MPDDEDLTEEQIARRRDAAIHRALNTAPKQHKDMKKGIGKGGRRKRLQDAEHAPKR